MKIGIEIHQQLDTGKLFCRCSGELSEKPKPAFRRTLHPVTSEIGQVDRAALIEARRGKEIQYFADAETSCAVEWDEEPPHEPDPEAVRTAAQIARTLGSKPVDEIHFMRKILIDGSAVSGFQRTALIATGGSVDGIGISSVCLEEDSARPFEGGFCLDRLGIPLVEIATDPDITSGKQAKEVALKIGTLIRMAKVRRGLGTIRQDLNVSIPSGARVEIKGVQDLESIPLIVDYEASRQAKISQLKKRFGEEFSQIKEVTKEFAKTASPIFKDRQVFAFFLKNGASLFAEVLHEGKRVGKEIAEYVKSFGHKGFVHSDEDLMRYGIEKEVEGTKKILGAKDSDLIILASGSKEILGLVKERVGEFAEGVSEDTRRAKEDGSTEFMRPLPTGARMYPETDILPFALPKAKPLETPEHRLAGLKKILPAQVAEKLCLSPDFEIFSKLGRTKELGIFLTEHLPSIRRKGVDVKEEHIARALQLKVGCEGFADAVEKIARGEKPGGAKVEEDEVRKFVKKLVAEKKDYISKSRDPLKGLMGIVMEKYKGRISAGEIIRILKENLKN